jgi:hypothetical protein
MAYRHSKPADIRSTVRSRPLPAKSILAVLAVLFGAVAVIPTSAGAATLCPPGVSDATYCLTGNVSGLTLKKRSVSTSNDVSVGITMSCTSSSRCSGKLYLEGSRGRIYGSRRYSIGRRPGTVHVRLTPAGRHVLERAGRLAVTVTAVAGGLRSLVGRVLIIGVKKH